MSLSSSGLAGMVFTPECVAPRLPALCVVPASLSWWGGGGVRQSISMGELVSSRQIAAVFRSVPWHLRVSISSVRVDAVADRQLSSAPAH